MMAQQSPTIDQLREELRNANDRVRQLDREIGPIRKERKDFQRAQEQATSEKAAADVARGGLRAAERRIHTLERDLRSAQVARDTARRELEAVPGVPEPEELSEGTAGRQAQAAAGGWRFVAPIAGLMKNGKPLSVYRAEKSHGGGLVSKQAASAVGLLDALEEWERQLTARKSSPSGAVGETAGEESESAWSARQTALRKAGKLGATAA